MKKITFLLLFVATTLCAQVTLVDANFATYTSGALVGQNNWVQYNTASTIPLVVANGKITFDGNRTTDDQDAMQLFSSVIPQPTTGVTTLNFDIVLSVASAGNTTTPSYFLALNTLNTTVTTNNFQNARIAAIQNSDGYVFGGRVNGQTGYPFAYGTTKLTFNTTYALRAVIKMVAGNANDTLKLYVGPDFSNLSLHSTCAFTSTGTATDPTYGAALISQFGSATSIESGISVSSIKVTNQGTVVSGINNPSIADFKATISGKKLIIKDITDGSTVEIYSVSGVKVQSAQLVNGAVQLNNLSKGLYIVRVGNQSSKIML